MKHKLFLDGRSYSYDGEMGRQTHVLVGQRDENHFDPRGDLDEAARAAYMERVKTRTLSDAEEDAWIDFVRKQVGGYFRLKPLDWCASTEEAESLKSQFTAPEWINLSVVPVSRFIENA